MYVQIQPLATCSLFCCPSHIPNVVPDFPKMSWIMCHNHSKASLTIHEKNKSQNNPSTEARLNVSLQVLKPRYLPMKKMQNEKSLYLKLQMVKASLTVRAHRLTNRLSKHQISKTSTSPQPPTTMPSWGMVWWPSTTHANPGPQPKLENRAIPWDASNYQDFSQLFLPVKNFF